MISKNAMEWIMSDLVKQREWLEKTFMEDIELANISFRSVKRWKKHSIEFNGEVSLTKVSYATRGTANHERKSHFKTEVM